MTFDFSRNDCLNLEESLKSEWLETNGLGGYASNTIVGCHTRKYHGLLAVPVPELGGKFVLLSRVATSLHVGGNDFHLGTNKFPDVFHPTGHKYIKKVRFQTHPQATFKLGDIELVHEVMMPQGENTVMLRYELVSSKKTVTMRFQPRLAYRSIHGLTRENMYLRPKTYCLGDNVYKIDPYEGMPPLFLDTSANTVFYPGPNWMKNFEYLKERSRGFEYTEDLFCPGVIELELKEGDVFYLRASIKKPQISAEKLWTRERNRRVHEMEKFKGNSIPVRILKERAEQFIITNPRGEKSIVAGYHWFDEWGRDAMIALPGLTLGCGHYELALDILKTYAGHEQNGLIPNYLHLSGDHHAYNSVDASLWFFWAVQKYLKHTKDFDGVKKHLWAAISKIIMAFGTSQVPDVMVRENGLLWTGNEDTQLTWMDARVHGKPVTPRFGFAVEINALWYNALCFYRELCEVFRQEMPQMLADILVRVREGFVATFWKETWGCLADVVNDHGPDLSIRPNQIFAVSLPYCALDRDVQQKVVTCVTSHLLTPFGLRTLSPHDVAYHGEYHGAPEQRDAAYHQGTVWPWLLGHYVEAALKVSAHPAEEREKLMKKLSPLWTRHLREGCVGGISEIFNGDPPHTAKGAMQQAWSVGEVIRTLKMLEGKEI